MAPVAHVCALFDNADPNNPHKATWYHSLVWLNLHYIQTDSQPFHALSNRNMCIHHTYIDVCITYIQTYIHTNIQSCRSAGGRGTVSHTANKELKPAACQTWCYQALIQLVLICSIAILVRQHAGYVLPHDEGCIHEYRNCGLQYTMGMVERRLTDTHTHTHTHTHRLHTLQERLITGVLLSSRTKWQSQSARMKRIHWGHSFRVSPPQESNTGHACPERCLCSVLPHELSLNVTNSSGSLHPLPRSSVCAELKHLSSASLSASSAAR